MKSSISIYKPKNNRSLYFYNGALIIISFLQEKKIFDRRNISKRLIILNLIIEENGFIFKRFKQ